MNDLELEALELIVIKDPLLYLDEIAHAMECIFDQSYTISRICRAIRFSLGYTRKKVSAMARERCSLVRYLFRVSISAVLTNLDQLVFLDETSCSD